jgi:hypothetical protein
MPSWAGSSQVGGFRRDGPSNLVAEKERLMASIWDPVRDKGLAAQTSSHPTSCWSGS